MPWFKLNRNFALSTTKGHSVNFKKGERTWVPTLIISEAMAIGAVPEDPKDVEAVEAPEVKVLTDERRKAAIFAAFEKLMLRSQRGDFTASGQPHPRKLEDILGFDMIQREREALWEEYNAMKAEEANQ
jgi:hypothetical protein